MIDQVIDIDMTSERIKALGKAGRKHKFDHGHALALSGGVGKGGAARLAARAALRIGAGAATLACPPAAVIENAQALQAIMLIPIADGAKLGAVLRSDKRINAICAGPGFGFGRRQNDCVEAILRSQNHAVIDADGLSILADHDSIKGLLHDRVVLTPHAGEFARLFPQFSENTDSLHGKITATCAAAQQSGAVVLYKGVQTVIATPPGQVAIYDGTKNRHTAWLATAGSGDVLAGFITGLMARGFDAFEAAQVATYLHAACAISFGAGLIAEDLAEELPKVFQELGV